MFNPKRNYGNIVGRCFIGLGIMSLLSCAFGVFFQDRFALDLNGPIMIWIGWGLTQKRNGYRIAAIIISTLFMASTLLLLTVTFFEGGRGKYIQIGSIRIMDSPFWLSAVVLGSIGLFFGLTLMALLHPSTRGAFEIAALIRRSIPVCDVCGYNLTGNVSGTCPECGTPVTRELIGHRPVDDSA